MTNSTITATPATVAEVAPVKVPAKRELPNNIRAAAKSLKEARAAVKEAKAKADAAEALIRDFLAGSPEGTVGGFTVVKVQPGSNSHFDRDTLATAYPEAYTAALRVTNYDSIRVL